MSKWRSGRRRVLLQFSACTGSLGLVGCLQGGVGVGAFKLSNYTDVSYTSFDVQEDYSYTGRGRVERRRRDLRLRRCDRVAVERKFSTD